MKEKAVVVAKWVISGAIVAGGLLLSFKTGEAIGKGTGKLVEMVMTAGTGKEAGEETN